MQKTGNLATLFEMFATLFEKLNINQECWHAASLENWKNSDREEDHHVVGINLYRKEILEEKEVDIEVDIEVLEKPKSISTSGKLAEIVWG